METLLFIVIAAVVTIIQNKVTKARKNRELSKPRDDEEFEEETQESKPPRNLQDLIRQFEEAQRQAAQGNIEPPTPPVDDYSENYDDDDNEDEDDYEEDEVDLPVVTPANPNRITFREIAESVIQWEEVSTEYLQQAFGFSESTAQQVLAELQAHRIVGRDMGEGYCDLLIHDKNELANLFKREQREAEEKEAAAAQEEALKARREAELKHQKELAALEERAKQIREQASGASGSFNEIESGSKVGLVSPERKVSRNFNKAEIRRGFIWAKVIDEPRFKKRWNSRVR